MVFRSDEHGMRFLTTRYSSANYKRLIPFLDAADAKPDQYFRFTSEGYEPLVV